MQRVTNGKWRESTASCKHIFRCKLCNSTGQQFPSPKQSYLNSCLHTLCSECNETGRTCCPDAGDHAPAVPNILAMSFSKVQILIKHGEFEGIRCENCILRKVHKPSTHKCLDCKAFICSRCVETHKKVLFLKKHCLYSCDDLLRKDQLPVFLSSSTFCRAHTDCHIINWCNTCKVAVCSDCLIVAHRSHDTEGMRNVLLRKCSEIRHLRKETKLIEQLIEKNMSARKISSIYIDEQQKSEIEVILAASLDTAVEIRMINDLEVANADKKALLRENEPEKSALEIIQNSNKVAAIAEFLSSMGTIFREHIVTNLDMVCMQLNKIAFLYKCTQFEIPRISTTYFSAHTHSGIPKLTNSFISPRESTLTCDDECTVWDCLKAILRGTSQSVCGMNMGGDSVIACIYNRNTDTEKGCRVRDNENGTYTITFIPKVPGKHELSVFINDHPLVRNPKSITVKSNIFCYDKNGIVHMSCITNPIKLNSTLITMNANGRLKLTMYDHKNPTVACKTRVVYLKKLKIIKNWKIASCNNYIAVIGTPRKTKTDTSPLKLLVFDNAGTNVMDMTIFIVVEDIAIISEVANDSSKTGIGWFKVLLIENTNPFCIHQIQSTCGRRDVSVTNYYYRIMCPIDENRVLLLGSNKAAIWQPNDDKMSRIGWRLSTITKYTICSNGEHILIVQNDGKNNVLKVFDINGKYKKTMPLPTITNYQDIMIVADRLGYVYVAGVKKGKYCATFPTEIVKIKY